MVTAAAPRQAQLARRHHQAPWLNLLAEYRLWQYRVLHIPGRSNLGPADFMTRKRFRNAPGQR